MTGEQLYGMYRERCGEHGIDMPPWHYISKAHQQVWIELAADVGAH